MSNPFVNRTLVCAGLMLACLSTPAPAQTILVDTYVVETGLPDGTYVQGNRTSFESDAAGRCYVGLEHGMYTGYTVADNCKEMTICEFRHESGPIQLVPTWEQGRYPPLFRTSKGETESISFLKCHTGADMQSSIRGSESWEALDSWALSECSSDYFSRSNIITACTKGQDSAGPVWFVLHESNVSPILFNRCGTIRLMRFDEATCVEEVSGLPEIETLLAGAEGEFLGFDLYHDRLRQIRISSGEFSESEFLLEGQIRVSTDTSKITATSCLTPSGPIVAVAPVFRGNSGYLDQALRLVSDLDSESPSVEVICELADGFSAAESFRTTGANAELKTDENGGIHLCFQDQAILRKRSNSSSLLLYPGQWRHAYRAPGSEEWVFSTIFRQRSPHLNQGYFEYFEMFGYTVSPGGAYLSTIGQIRTAEGTDTVQPHQVLQMRAINFGGLDVVPSPRASLGAVLGYVVPTSLAWSGNADAAIDVADYVARTQS